MKFLRAAMAAAAFTAFNVVAAAPVAIGPLNPSASFSNTVHGKFTDTYTFTLDTPAAVAASLTNVSLTFNGFTVGEIDDFAAELNGAELVFSTVTAGTNPSVTTQVLSGGVSLPIGAYTLTVTGTAKGNNSSYGGNIVAVSAVPEPSTYALLVAGMLGISATRLRGRK